MSELVVQCNLLTKLALSMDDARKRDFLTCVLYLKLSGCGLSRVDRGAFRRFRLVSGDERYYALIMRRYFGYHYRCLKGYIHCAPCALDLN